MSLVLGFTRWHNDWHPTWLEIKAVKCTILRPEAHMPQTSSPVQYLDGLNLRQSIQSLLRLITLLNSDIELCLVLDKTFPKSRLGNSDPLSSQFWTVLLWLFVVIPVVECFWVMMEACTGGRSSMRATLGYFYFCSYIYSGLSKGGSWPSVVLVVVMWWHCSYKTSSK